MADIHPGDKGKTLLSTPTPVGKDDVRLDAIGTLEELIAELRYAALAGDGPHCPRLGRLTAVLTRLCEYIRTGGRAVLLPRPDELAELDTLIPRLATPTAPVGTALTEASARNLRAANVCRRAERALVHCARIYPMAEAATAYLNRLSEFLFALARYGDYHAEHGEATAAKEAAVPVKPAEATAPAMDTDGLVRAVLAALGEKPMMTLDEAKDLINAIEAHAKERGMQAVIAIVNAEGNPIAVHVMDGAYLVSFEVAVKKARTAVAVKMPTIALAELVGRGGTFQGLDKITDVVTFGGGVPLYRGDRLIGGLGISGGTGEDDHALCEFALTLLR